MSGRVAQLIVAMALIFPLVIRAQLGEPRLIDEFEKLNSEDATARFQRAMTQLALRLETRPSSKLEFILYRGAAQTLGEPYRAFGIQKAFFAAERYDTKRIVWTICGPVLRPSNQIWLIDSLAQRHECSQDEPKFDKPLLFTTTVAPNSKYAIGGCCVIDEIGYAASMETLRAFAMFLKNYPQTTAYVVLYGGTNVYGTSIPPGPEKMVRHPDPQSFVAKLSKDVVRQLEAGGLDRSRLVILNGGYRDSYASIDIWIIPPGGKRPKPTPNYFVNSKRPSTSLRSRKR